MNYYVTDQVDCEKKRKLVWCGVSTNERKHHPYTGNLF